MPITALLLDFDGLICDTERAARRSWEILYRRHQLAFPPEVWAAMLGRPQGETYATRDLAQRLGREPSAEELLERRRTKSRLANDEPLRPGIRRLLAQAAERAIRCAIVSSSNPAWVIGHLDRLKVRKHFSCIVTGDHAALPKPAPLLHLRALELLDVAARSSIAIEDSAVGVAAAKAAGLMCIAVPGACGDRSSLGAADLVLDSLEDLSILDSMAKAICV